MVDIIILLMLSIIDCSLWANGDDGPVCNLISYGFILKNLVFD